MFHILKSDAGKKSIETAGQLVAHVDSNLQHIGLSNDRLFEHVQKTFESFVDNLACEYQSLDDDLRKIDITNCEQKDLNRLSFLQGRLGREMKQLMDQFLVDCLSRSALIPTYSFPVHSVSLNITQDKKSYNFDDDRALRLDRDAALGIREYAPGAEVVAGGRIWVSAGIVRQPEQYMPTKFYRICDTCQHPQIAASFEALQNAPLCEQCNQVADAQVFSFIQPKGFLTSYDKKEGRDPGASRMFTTTNFRSTSIDTSPF